VAAAPEIRKGGCNVNALLARHSAARDDGAKRKWDVRQAGSDKAANANGNVLAASERFSRNDVCSRPCTTEAARCYRQLVGVGRPSHCAGPQGMVPSSHFLPLRMAKVVLRPSQDRINALGDVITISDLKDDKHWMVTSRIV
jgi:hypothetical protein